MKNKEIYIISNESIQEDSKNYYCDNLDLKSIPEGLNNTFNVNVIARKSRLKRYHVINNVNIKVASSLFTFIKLIPFSLKYSQRFDPTKPEAPVISVFMLFSLLKYIFHIYD